MSKIEVKIERTITLDSFLYRQISALLPHSNTGAIRATQYASNVGIDWLQVSFLGVLKIDGYFTVKKLDLHSRTFSEIYEISTESNIIGTMQVKPFSPVINPSLCIFKFENRMLYKYDCVKMIPYLAKMLDMKFIHITRLDLFSDFNTFHNSLKPANLIKRFISGEYLKVNKSKFNVIGKSGSELEYQYLKFGSNTSDVVCYLYNKSAEMLEVKEKPYIRECWVAKNLDKKSDVWRLEVSIKKGSSDVLDMLSGELTKLDVDFLQVYENVYKLYYSLIYKYFRFVKNEGKDKKNRNNPVVLFQNIIESLRLYTVTECLDSNISQKIFIKKLYLHNIFMQEKGIKGAEEREQILSDYIDLHAMRPFFNSRILNVLT